MTVAYLDMPRRKAPIATSHSVELTDLVREVFTTVAVSRKPGEWEWFLPPREVGVFMMARNDGGIVSAQRKISDGVYELKAKLSQARKR